MIVSIYIYFGNIKWVFNGARDSADRLEGLESFEDKR
jgi:hypothetical protein